MKRLLLVCLSLCVLVLLVLSIWYARTGFSIIRPKELTSTDLMKGPLYVVIDLSEGAHATTYPMSYLSETPPRGWTKAYKTDKLVLRRIEAGSFMMGSPDYETGRRPSEYLRKVTLTKPYYMGVFEITQKQWELVMGNNPTRDKGDARPVGQVSYYDIRGTSKGRQWPKHAEVDDASFMGRLRAKTMFDFDLPTEAQWEYACRAGTTTALNSGKDLTSTWKCSNMDEVGRYKYNGRKTNMVGSYVPNAWGLYDMHGNVGEWCLDWYTFSKAESKIDPVGRGLSRERGNPMEDQRLARGGSFSSSVQYCRSAFRTSYIPSTKSAILGLRAVIRPRQ